MIFDFTGERQWHTGFDGRGARQVCIEAVVPVLSLDRARQSRLHLATAAPRKFSGSSIDDRSCSPVESKWILMLFSP